MPSNVYLHLKGVTKLHQVKDGDSVETDAASGKVKVMDVLGEVVGLFNADIVLGWSVEHSPVNLLDISQKDLERLIAEINKYGTVKLPGSEGEQPQPEESGKD